MGDRVFIGTYTDPTAQAGRPVTPAAPVMGMTGPTGSSGIYTLAHDPATGDWAELAQTEDVVNPSFLALSPDGRVLFAVNETRAYAGAATGAVSSFAVEAGGALRPLSQVASGGANPCHLTVTPDGRFLLVANHEAATIAVLPITPGGELRPAVAVVDDADPAAAGSGPPHVHFVTNDPTGAYVRTPNTGTDRIRVFRLDAHTGQLDAIEGAEGATHAGGSPRHLAFHPGGRHLFANGEADLTLSLFRFAPETGALTYLTAVSTLPPGTSGRFSTAQIVAHPNGRTVYVSNRGHDSIAVFAFDAAHETVTLETMVPTGGRTPRNFALDPTGAFLYVAHQNDDAVSRFTVDQATGQLGAPVRVAAVPAPTCILFAPGPAPDEADTAAASGPVAASG